VTKVGREPRGYLLVRVRFSSLDGDEIYVRMHHNKWDGQHGGRVRSG